VVYFSSTSGARRPDSFCIRSSPSPPPGSCDVSRPGRPSPLPVRQGRLGFFNFPLSSLLIMTSVGSCLHVSPRCSLRWTPCSGLAPPLPPLTCPNLDPKTLLFPRLARVPVTPSPLRLFPIGAGIYLSIFICPMTTLLHAFFPLVLNQVVVPFFTDPLLPTYHHRCSRRVPSPPLVANVTVAFPRRLRVVYETVTRHSPIAFLRGSVT